MITRLLTFLAASEFSWVDVADILIVAFIIYQLLQFLRGTHAVQMALGAMVLVIFFWLSQWADLERMIGPPRTSPQSSPASCRRHRESGADRDDVHSKRVSAAISVRRRAPSRPWRDRATPTSVRTLLIDPLSIEV